MRYYSWTKGEDIELSPHFRSGEFSCQCAHSDCVLQTVSMDLIDKLERVRVEVGRPIKVTSGFRCAKHQAELVAGNRVKTVPNSTHQLGHAADISCAQMTPLMEACRKEFKAIGIAKTFLHVDLRDDKVRRWTY